MRSDKKERLLSPILLAFMGTMILANIAAQMIMPLESLYVQDLGASVEQIGLFFTIAAIAPLFLQIFGGWLSDRWGRKPAIFLSLVATGPVLYLLTILPYNAGFVMILVAFGMFRYMTQATMQPYVMSSVPPYLRATAFGIYFGLAMEGQSLIQPVAGHFMDIYGISSIFTVIALISAGLSLMTLLLAKRA